VFARLLADELEHLDDVDYAFTIEVLQARLRWLEAYLADSEPPIRVLADRL
jgi:hypothetical protein